MHKRGYTRLATLLVVAAGMAVTGGCGSTHSSSTSPAVFQASANSVCTKYNGQEQALPKPNSTDLPSVSSYVNKVVTLGQAEFSSLKGLSVPSADTQRMSSVFDGMQQQINTAQQVAGSLQSGQLGSASTSLQKLQAGDPSLNQQFDSLGLTSCAQ
jgi:hypothetical protein